MAHKSYADYKKEKGKEASSSFSSSYSAYKWENDYEGVANSLNNRVSNWLKNTEAMRHDSDSRYTNRDFTYRDSYVSDSADWLSRISTYKSKLDKEADEIRALLESGKSYIDSKDYDNIIKILDSGKASSDDVLSLASSDANYWSNFGDAKTYGEWVNEEIKKEKYRGTDIDAVQSEISALESKYKDAYDVNKRLTEISSLVGAVASGIRVGDLKALTAERDSLLAQMKEYGTLDSIKKEISEKTSVYNNARWLQEKEGFVNDARNASDFETYAAKGANMGEEVGGISTKHLNDDEKKVVAYYLGKGDSASAERYMRYLEDELNLREASADFGEYENKTALEYAFGIWAGIEQFGSSVAGLFSDSDLPTATSKTQYTSQLIREDLADVGADLPDWLGGGSVGQLGYEAVTTTSNMLPSILASVAVPVAGQALGVGAAAAGVAGAVVGNTLMGASAAGSARTEMLNLGYSEKQANSYAALIGASEMGLQSVLGGFSSLGGITKVTAKALDKIDNALGRAAVSGIMNMAGEGIEEGLQTALEPWLKHAVTNVDFDAPNIDEILYSGLLGAIASAGIGTPSAAIRGTANTVSNIRKGNQIKKIDGAVDTLVGLGKSFESLDSAAYKIAGKVNEKTGAYTIGKLFREVGATLSEQNLADITAGLEERNMDHDNASKLAKQYQKILNGEMRLTDDQVKLLENAAPLTDVLKKNIIGANTTVYQRTRAFADVVAQMNGEKANESVETESKMSPEEFAERLARVDSTPQSASFGGVSPLQSIPASTKTKTPELTKLSVSDTGKTISKDSGEEISVKEISSTKDGKVVLRMKDGSLSDANSVIFGSENDAVIYGVVSDMAKEPGIGMNAVTANAMVRGFESSKGITASEYAHGFKDAYRYGAQGIPLKELEKGVFTSLLSDETRRTAYEMGKEFGKEKTKEQQATVDSKRIASEKTKKNGKVHLEKGIITKTFSERQNASIAALEKIADALGIEFHIFESEVVNGKRKGANGWFDPKDSSIHIDLFAGNDGRGTILMTGAHELTHFIRKWSPEKFKVFADFLLENYGENGVPVDELVRLQIDKAKRNGREIGYDEAYEEVVADSCESFLADGDVVEKIADLKARDKGLWEKIKSFINNLVKRIKEVYAGVDPDSLEGQYVSSMVDAVEKLKSMWTEALVDAADAYNASGMVEIDTESQSVSPLLSERTWTESEYVTDREKTAKAISKSIGVTLETAYKYIDDINSVARLIADDRVRLDYEPNLDESATVLKPNSEYKYSVDMSTLCAKRLLFTGTFDAIQRALPNTVFDSDDIVRLREMMQTRGYEVACGICYVESTRREIGRITQDFIDRYKIAQETGKPITRINSSGKVVELKKTNDQKKTTVDKTTDSFFAEKDYTPTLADLNTTDIDFVKRDHPLVYEAYLNFMNARGQAKPKLLETRAEYKGEILRSFKAKSAVDSRNKAGGLRLQSFSDFEVAHLIDMMQITMDMSRVGLKSQAYTKVPAFADVFGDTGIKINLSLIAKGDGLDANGNLIFDDVEGINHKEAFKLRDKYSKNVGTILVGKNDAHIIAAMSDHRIDYIIPFHKSSWKESLYDALGLTGYDDYTDYQNEKPIDKDREIKNFDPSEYWDFSKSGDENAQIYLEKCREDGRIPKFTQFQGYPGYWKLLIDFKMYDNDGVGSPQEVVKPELNMEASERILSAYEGGHRSLPVAKDVVEDFVKGRTYIDSDTVKRSERDTESVSNRSLLADALESAAKDDDERAALEDYKEHLVTIDALDEKLTEIKAKIKELSFAKGPRDNASLKKLRAEERKTVNRIDVWDKRLIRLEAGKPIRDLLAREKDKAYKRAEQKGRDLLKERREKASKDEMRIRILNSVKRLDQILNRGTKKRNVKEELRGTVSKSLELAEVLFSNNITNLDIVKLGVESVTTEEGQLLSEYKATIDKIQRLEKELEESGSSADADINKLVSLEEDIKKEKNKIYRLDRKLSDVFARERARLNRTTADKIAESLAREYLNLKTSGVDYIKAAYDDFIYDRLETLRESIKGTLVKDMDAYQLAEFYDAYKMIEKFVSGANKLFKSGKAESVQKKAETVNVEVKKVAGQPYKQNVVTSTLKKAGWQLLKPYVAFRTIGSDALTELYKEVRNGEDVFYVDVKEAQTVLEKSQQKNKYKTWDLKKLHNFQSKSGKTFQLSLEQMMSLYAYTKRPEAHKHIIDGGVVFEDSLVIEKSKLGVPVAYQVTTKDAFNISAETLESIENALTKEQKAYVDEMQSYLSDVMGAKGNEISRELYGIDLYKDKNYLPIKSSNYYMNFKPEEAGEVKLRSPGFSKETVPNADNPIVLHNFTDLWAEHVNDMSMYHAFVLPLEDFTRVYNFKTKTDPVLGTMDTKATIETAYPGAVNYINKFLRDLNGGVRSETVGWAEKLANLSKRGAVLGSLSVAIQQPSAVMRAMAIINPKYFVQSSVESANLVKHKKDWEELKKYAPIAGIKEMGIFDVGMGRATEDWIKNDATAFEKLTEKASSLPGYMDEVTWVSIWNAVKRETVHLHKNLRPGSEQFMKVAGERFTDVISLTQVYDSVFSRSDLMRNKSFLAKSLTAFMAEPSTTLNMLFDAYIQAKRSGSRKEFAKISAGAVGAVVASFVLNAALKSVIMAMRDEDEDEAWIEKYLEHFFGDLKDSMNPLTMIPLVKDVVSVFSGYDVERMDMALISDLKKALDGFDGESKNEYEKWADLTGAISAFFGVPLKNVEREISAVYNLVFGEREAMTSEGVKYAVYKGITGKTKTNAQQLYEALMKGDEKHASRVENRFKDDAAAGSALRSALRENDSRIKAAAQKLLSGDIRSFSDYISKVSGDGVFTEEEVEKAIRTEASNFESKIKAAAEAKRDGKMDEYKKVVRDLRDSYKGILTQDEIVKAVDNYKFEEKKTSDGEESSSIYKASDINSALDGGDTELAMEIIGDLLNTKTENFYSDAKREAEKEGKRFNENTARKEAEAKAKSSLKSSLTSYWKPLYKAAQKAGDQEEMKRIRFLLRDSGLYGRASDVAETVRGWLSGD